MSEHQEKARADMGRSRYRILQQDAPHFLTLTILNWIPLFTRPATVEILLDAIRHRQQHQGWRVYGWVVLENHMLCDAAHNT